MGLKEYKRKRDFKKTAEPAGAAKASGRKTPALHFVIQKHDASRLHYDFRLEMEGVLKSWAVPKGLPWAQAEKHLAVEVEDHPIEYADFEGIIPEGQYGGGTVMVWDRGTYELTPPGDPVEAVRKGKFHLILHGDKAKGEWALIRIRPQDGKNQWLLMKTAGGVKPLSKKRDDQSVKTGRTMKQIASARDAEWQSNRANEKDSFKARIAKAARNASLKKKDESEGEAVHQTAPGASKQSDPFVDTSLAGLPKAKPRFIEPMKPKLVEHAPTTGDWLYELKFDGIRALAIKNGRTVQLISRNEKKLNDRFPEIAQAAADFDAHECVVDGEVVAMDKEGRSSFQLLQRAELDDRDAPLAFYVFDLLQWDGRSLIALPLMVRKELLTRLVPTGDVIRFSGALGSDAKTLLPEIKRRGLEGLIGKQRNSVYEPGRRSGIWIKLKCVTEQEFVIGGFTPPAGARKHFGALLVGYYSEGSASLRFAGKVGTGFDTKLLSSLHKRMRAEERNTCPFTDLPSKQNGEWVQGITPSMMRKMHWVNPKLVCQVKFSEWTRDSKLRQPVFVGLREDKDPREVVRET
ncbi:MAG TPA: non-homologous end-joining DNA ligase [Chthoniobacterales bacterium]|nr:non-homologous end-joining DNA ligase [Chthoniobacterales bacterium]